MFHYHIYFSNISFPKFETMYIGKQTLTILECAKGYQMDMNYIFKLPIKQRTHRHQDNLLNQSKHVFVHY